MIDKKQLRKLGYRLDLKGNYTKNIINNQKNYGLVKIDTNGNIEFTNVSDEQQIEILKELI